MVANFFATWVADCLRRGKNIKTEVSKIIGVGGLFRLGGGGREGNLSEYLEPDYGPFGP